jgi:hypothetical protein
LFASSETPKRFFSTEHAIADWLAMTRKKSLTKLKSLDKKQSSVEEMLESLRSVGDDVEQIVKLTSDEKRLVAELLSSLKSVPHQMFSIPVSTSELPFGIGAFTQAHIDSTGHLILASEDGNLEVKDLSEAKNRDLMMAVVGDIVPKFKDFASQIAEEKLQKSSQVQEIPPPEPFHLIPMEEEVPFELPVVDFQSVEEEVPFELPSSEVESVPEEVPVYSVEEKAKIEEAAAETLNDLETLGNEVFNQSPVSVYFDDWLVHLRQVILGFESSDVISVDEAFTDECEQIFRDIEEELASRLLKEAELEASAKTLAEKRHILGEMDAEYAAQTKYLKVRGKSAIDFLIKNVQRLEEDLEKIQQTRTFNPIKRIAKEQKRYSVTKKLKAAKQRLALAMQNSSVEQEKLEEMDSEYAIQTRSLKVKEKNSMDALIKNVNELEEELAKIRQTRTLNPIKRIAKEQQLTEVTEELNTAKQKLALAAQNSTVEQKRIQDEYEQKKQTTIKNVLSLEKEIATKKADNSLEARKAATKALAKAVKSLIKRNTEPAEST